MDCRGFKVAQITITLMEQMQSCCQDDNHHKLREREREREKSTSDPLSLFSLVSLSLSPLFSLSLFRFGSTTVWKENDLRAHYGELQRFTAFVSGR